MIEIPIYHAWLNSDRESDEVLHRLIELHQLTLKNTHLSQLTAQIGRNYASIDFYGVVNLHQMEWISENIDRADYHYKAINDNHKPLTLATLLLVIHDPTSATFFKLFCP